MRFKGLGSFGFYFLIDVWYNMRL